MEIIVYSIMIFIIGVCFGSFFNVVGYRLPNNMSIVYPPSHIYFKKEDVNIVMKRYQSFILCLNF